jgi:hypothetical protein
MMEWIFMAIVLVFLIALVICEVLIYKDRGEW